MKLIDDLFDLRGKVAAITGGARVGAETARTLAAAGAKASRFSTCCRTGGSAGRVKSGAGRLRPRSGRSTSARGRCGTRVRRDRRAGRLTPAVNNAGIEGHNVPTTVTLAQWRRVQDVNVNGVFLCTRAAIPHIDAAGGGSIVNPSRCTGSSAGVDVPRVSRVEGGGADDGEGRCDVVRGEEHPCELGASGYIRTPMLEEAFRQMGQDPDRAFGTCRPTCRWRRSAARATSRPASCISCRRRAVTTQARVS